MKPRAPFTIALVVTAAAVMFVLASASVSNGNAFCMPNDSCWPSLSEFQSLNISIAGVVLLPHDYNFQRALKQPQNRLFVDPPGVIVAPKRPEDAVTAINFAIKHNMRVSAMSTGHDFQGRNVESGSMQLNSYYLDDVSVDVERTRVTVGPGAKWGKVFAEVSAKSNNTLIAIGGYDPTVGVCGWMLGGGHR